MKIAITGASGYVGAALTKHLLAQKHSVTELSRSSDCSPQIDYSNANELLAELQGHQALVHLIGKTHSQDSMEALADYREINVELSKTIAKAAAKAGIKTFIYLSSIKAMGENRPTPYQADDTPAPTTAYGISKLEAEKALQSICDRSGMKLIIIRPPLIYSPTAKGNIEQLKRVLLKGIPLPLKSIRNKRSIVTLADLCKIIQISLEKKTGQCLLLPGSPPSLSTPELIERIASDNSLSSFMIPFPTIFLKAGLSCLGKSETHRKLCGSLEIVPNITTY